MTRRNLLDSYINKNKNKLVYAYNTIDSKTRFLLASTLTKNRGIKETRRHFKEVKKQSNKKKEKEGRE